MSATGTAKSGRTVLVIDEDARIAQLVRTALRGLDYAVISSTRPEEGLLLAARHKPAVVLIEARFRSTDGIELAGKLIRAPGTSGSAVSILTGDEAFHRRLRALQLGVSDYLRKPLAAPVLRQRLDALCRVARRPPARQEPSAAARRLVDVVREIEQRSATGTLSLEGARGAATLAFTGGGLQVAQLGSLAGLHAFDAIARAGDWDLRYTGDPLGIDPGQPVDDLAPLPLYDEPSTSELSVDEHTVLDPALELRIMQSVDAPAPPEQGLVLSATSEVPTDPQYAPRPQPALVPTTPEVPLRAAGRAPAASTGPSADAAAEVRQSGEVERERVGAWLEAAPQGPLLVALSDERMREAARAAAAARGLHATCAGTAAEAYRAARVARPCAMLADTAFADAEGRELLAGVRGDFSIRELPVILCASAAVRALIDAGKPLDPILAGVDRALAPHARLWEQLAEAAGPVEGVVEPVGVAKLMQMLGALGFSGRVELRAGDQRNAEAVFEGGHLCGVVVNAPQSSVGPLAMLNLLGYEWASFSVLPGAIGASIPLGELHGMIDAAARQNNTLLRRAFDGGLKAADIAVDRGCLDAYLRGAPASSLALLLRLGEGEPAAGIAAAGEVTAPALKALLFDMRRKAVIRVHTLKSLRIAEAELSGMQPVAPELAAPDRTPRRWLVVAISTFVTVAVASAGYLAYRHLYGG